MAHAGRLGIQPALVLADFKAAPELADLCAAQGVPFKRVARMPRAEFDAEVAAACITAELDLLALTFDWLIAPELVQHYRGRIINVHPALLPAFKGMKAMDQALAGGVRYIGATIHDVDEDMDHGAIIAQCVLGLRSGDTAASAGARLFNLMRLMYLQVIRWYAEGRVHKDERGLISVRDAAYGELPISPGVEMSFPD